MRNGFWKPCFLYSEKVRKQILLYSFSMYIEIKSFISNCAMLSHSHVSPYSDPQCLQPSRLAQTCAMRQITMLRLSETWS